MANLIGTWFWGRSRPDNGAARLEPRTEPQSIRSLECRRLKLLLVLTFCAITGARPGMAGFVQQPIVTPVLLPVQTQRDLGLVLVGDRSNGMPLNRFGVTAEFPKGPVLVRMRACGFDTGIAGPTREPHPPPGVFLPGQESGRGKK